MRGLFLTATDTGAGKTYVTAGIARIWRREQRPFRVCKPVATGAEGRWSEDTRLLAEAAGDADLEAVTPFTFAAPAAPPVAARLAGTAGRCREPSGTCESGSARGTYLELEDLAAAIHRRATGGKTVLVEGVGGLLCPLTERETVADLVRELDLPLVVVTRRSLGTLNHTLLTVEAAQRRTLRLAGLVVTATTPVQGVAEETNVEELRRRLNIPLLVVLPHQPTVTGGDDSILAAIDWWRLAS